MPLIPSAYHPPFWLRNPHIQTILPALFRKKIKVFTRQQRIDTPDGDFVDVDQAIRSSGRMALLIHGLEASSQSNYITGMAKALLESGFDVSAMNLRTCGTEMNRLPRAYHSGATDDVVTVVDFLLKECDSLVLVGFSLGGNLVLKYLGEQGSKLHSAVKKAMAVSVPCDLEAASRHLDGSRTSVYRRRFMKSLRQKVHHRILHHDFPLSEKQVEKMKTFREYDDLFTAPMFGFKDASDYYRKCSSKQFIRSISIPTLILTAADDPFFTKSCLPFRECENHPLVMLEVPQYGGHVGFMMQGINGEYYTEKRATEFFSS